MPKFKNVSYFQIERLVENGREVIIHDRAEGREYTANGLTLAEWATLKPKLEAEEHDWDRSTYDIYTAEDNEEDEDESVSD